MENIFPSLKLKFNILKNTNDPKEKKITSRHLIEDIEFAGEFIGVSAAFSVLIDNDYKICCFSTDYIKDDKKFFGYNLPRMWASYGDNHKGVCLMVDKNKFIEENHIDNLESFLLEVDYSSIPNNYFKNIDLPDNLDYWQKSDAIIKHNLKQIFFTKHHDWITEHEIRMVANSQEKYCSISNSLVKIILGIEFKSVYKALIIKQLTGLKKIDADFVQQLKFNHKVGELEL